MGDIIRKKKNGRDLGRYIRWTENGKRRQRASHQTSYALAKRMLLEIEARVARGMVGIVEPDARQQITVAELCARFLQEYSSPRVKNLARYRQYAASRLRRALPHIGEVRLSELGRAHVIKARDILAKNCPPGTTPKYGQVRQLRLPSALVPILRAWREQCPPTARGLVCPIWDRGRWHMSMSTGKTHGLPKLLKAANCQQVSGCWHMLRHTFASHYMMAGGSLLALSKILGHSNMVMTMVYAHRAPDYLDREMERVKF